MRCARRPRRLCRAGDGARQWRLDLAGTLAALELALLAEGLHRSPFFDLALVVAVLSLAGGLTFARFLGRWI
jgi:multisubunit Na+/H+ antiporter MnhF subunit